MMSQHRRVLGAGRVVRERPTAKTRLLLPLNGVYFIG